MLLGTLRNVSILLIPGIVLVMVVFLGYVSKPDRGGLGRCEKVFGFDSLSCRGLTHVPLVIWVPFEDPKFKMRINVDKADDLMSYFAGLGYSNWTRGGVQFGSIDMGWEASSEVYYSEKEVGISNHYLVHDRENNVLFAIASQ
jgi:hypothetical protein